MLDASREQKGERDLATLRATRMLARCCHALDLHDRALALERDASALGPVLLGENWRESIEAAV